LGVLLITCPVTSKEFSTGVQIDSRDASMLPDVESEALCTFCEQVHRWRPRQARWVEAIGPDDWIENQ
jgi:hypothetical protein